MKRVHLEQSRPWSRRALAGSDVEPVIAQSLCRRAALPAGTIRAMSDTGHAHKRLTDFADCAG